MKQMKNILIKKKRVINFRKNQNFKNDVSNPKNISVGETLNFQTTNKNCNSDSSIFFDYSNQKDSVEKSFLDSYSNIRKSSFEAKRDIIKNNENNNNVTSAIIYLTENIFENQIDIGLNHGTIIIGFFSL